jgi:ectoine hydroxylase-related dioxygenase (phytanoyl-CoA dioxygenase family)
VSNNCWNPYVENLHTDQNPSYKQGFHCVQGMVPLIDVHAGGAGGLQLVHDTNNDKTQEELCKRYPWVENSKSDWVELKGNDPYIGTGKLVECKAGDLILFDSRTIHGGKINDPSPAFKENNMNQLARLAMTVTMVPRDKQSAMNKERRLNAFKSRIGLTHWPQEYNKSAFGTMAMNIDK